MFLSQLRESKYATVILACIFAFTLFLQCCFFHWQAFHSIYISSLWNDPIAFFTFYAPKISISLFIASFVFLFKRKSWTVYVSFIVSIWCIAELVYYRANGIFLDSFSFTMISNMDGFWDSVYIYIYTLDFIIFIPSLLILISYVLLKNSQRKIINNIIFLITSIVLHIGSVFGIFEIYHSSSFVRNSLKFVYFNPIHNEGVHTFWGFTSSEYLKQTSPIHAIIYEAKNLLFLPFEQNNYTLTSNEKYTINRLIEFRYGINDENKLIIILIESFEDWAITEYVMPNVYNFVQQHTNIFYHKRIISQTKGGTSADGQMIVNTGLLPIKEGATCFRYPHNIYPALSKLYKKSLGVIPGDKGVWNQGKMCDAYGITNDIYIPSCNDSTMFSILNKHLLEYDYILALTVASHAPFQAYAESSNLLLSENMPIHMSNYLKSISYTDIHLSEFLSKVDSDSTLHNATIVITGDHTIFPSEMRKEFSDYCKANNLDYKVEEKYCPLIIYSPNIKEKTIVDEVAYQMDIYPTILHVIGAEDYYWKGFGVNLLDSVARKNRPISPEDAFELSDKLIRANYFKEIESQLSKK